MRFGWGLREKARTLHEGSWSVKEFGLKPVVALKGLNQEGDISLFHYRVLEVHCRKKSACKEREGKTLRILYLCKYVHIKTVFLETAF